MKPVVKQKHKGLVPQNRTPDRTETYAGKYTARVTKVFDQPDGSVVRATRKINKDGSITDKIEHRHN